MVLRSQFHVMNSRGFYAGTPACFARCSLMLFPNPALGSSCICTCICLLLSSFASKQSRYILSTARVPRGNYAHDRCYLIWQELKDRSHITFVFSAWNRSTRHEVRIGLRIQRPPGVYLHGPTSFFVWTSGKAQYVGYIARQTCEGNHLCV